MLNVGRSNGRFPLSNHQLHLTLSTPGISEARSKVPTDGNPFTKMTRKFFRDWICFWSWIIVLGPFPATWSKAITIFKRKVQLLKPSYFLMFSFLNSFIFFNVLILNNFTMTSKTIFKEAISTYNPSIVLCVLLNSFIHRSVLCAYICISLKGITSSVEVP